MSYIETVNNTQIAVNWMTRPPLSFPEFEFGWRVRIFQNLPFMAEGENVNWYLVALVDSCDQLFAAGGSPNLPDAYMQLLQIMANQTPPDGVPPRPDANCEA